MPKYEFRRIRSNKVNTRKILLLLVMVLLVFCVVLETALLPEDNFVSYVPKIFRLYSLSKQIEEYIPKIPTNNCLCGISVYFNPLNSLRKKANYDQFAQIVRAQGLNLTVIELYIDKPEVNGDYADQYKAIKMDEAHTKYPLWQKEALINVGISYLDEIGATCKNIAWLDIEIMLSYPYWIEEVCAGLETYSFVQPFVTNKRLSREETLKFDLKAFVDDIKRSDDDLYQHRDNIEIECKKRSFGVYEYRHGMIWTARREIFKDFRLFPYGIVGGGDTILLSALFDNSKRTIEWIGNNSFTKYIVKWADSYHLTERFSNNIGHLNKTYLSDTKKPDIIHFWHGDDSNRKYASRVKLLKKYNPERDIEISEEKGYIYWSEYALTKNKILIERVKKYFSSRNEEGKSRKRSFP